MITILTARTEQEFATGKSLIQEYADSLNIDLSYQNFENELETLYTQYNNPEGALLIAFYDTIPVGCVAIRKSAPQIAELKRMYVRPEYRGHHIGKKMLQHAFSAAKDLGYKRIRLDTIRSMSHAIYLYKLFGFELIPPYHINPSDEAVFMEKVLI